MDVLFFHHPTIKLLEVFLKFNKTVISLPSSKKLFRVRFQLDMMFLVKNAEVF